MYYVTPANSIYSPYFRVIALELGNYSLIGTVFAGAARSGMQIDQKYMAIIIYITIEVSWNESTSSGIKEMSSESLLPINRV